MTQADSIARILVTDAISEKGIDLLRSTPGFEVEVALNVPQAELARVLGQYDALIVRSATEVTAEVLRQPGRLKVIGRAGTGVDNIDLAAATRAGVVVLNTPGGNSVAAAELTLSLLLALARNVPQANADLRQGRWERKKYIGVELAGKVLGVVGLGRIGREVARAAQGLRMEVWGYDPYVSSQVAQDQGIRFLPFNEILAGADFLTLHLPFSPESRHLIGADSMRRMKRGSFLINCARGGLVDEEALLAALESGHIAGAALDVFETEPPTNRRLIDHPRVVSTPHLGASTLEAQERVGTEVAEKIREFFKSGVILDAVNFPSLGRESFAQLAPVMELAERLGRFLGQVAEGGFRRLQVGTFGVFAAQSLRPVVMAATKGLLSPVMGEGVSYVNALALAADRGITVEESRSNEASPFAGLLRLTLKTDAGEATVAGTLFDADRPRLVEVDGVSIESHPAGHLLYFRNRDVPGVVGQIGTILGRAQVNIAGIQLGRPNGGGTAVSIINVDSPVPAETLREIQQVREVVLVRSIKV